MEKREGEKRGEKRRMTEAESWMLIWRLERRRGGKQIKEGG